MNSTKAVEYICVYCGRRVVKPKGTGRPEPGTCPRKTNKRPHSWRRNREI